MRLSGHKGDPGFAPVEGRFAVIYLDGRKVDHVVTADEEQRAVVYYPYEKGAPIVKGDRIVEKVLVGDVIIRFRSDSPSWLKKQFPDRIEAV